MNNFCPDIDENKQDFYGIKNGYSNYENRISFSLQVELCNGYNKSQVNPNGTCEN